MKAIDYTKYGPMEKNVAIGRLPPKPFLDEIWRP